MRSCLEQKLSNARRTDAVFTTQKMILTFPASTIDEHIPDLPCVPAVPMPFLSGAS